MSNHVDHPILLLERDWYAKSGPRKGRFIDLRAGVSMWAHFNPRIIVSVLPEIPKGVDLSIHYKSLFDRTGADYCFASESGPLCWEKIARGKLALFTRIPGVSIQHTTDKVERLGPDDDLDGWLNTTDLVSKMLPDLEDATLFEYLESKLEPDLTEI